MYLHQREEKRLKAKYKEAARASTEKSLSTFLPPPMASLREHFEQKYWQEKSLEILFEDGYALGYHLNSLHIHHW